MAYDERLADRVRELLSERTDVTERRMFGGLTFMVAGHMCCGIHGDELILRLAPTAEETALRAPSARPMDLTRRADARLCHDLAGRAQGPEPGPLGRTGRRARGVSPARGQPSATRAN